MAVVRLGATIWCAAWDWLSSKIGADLSVGGGEHSTTFGWVVHTWYGQTSLRQELYHSRQYIDMGDWLMPFWVVGCIWGTISAAIKMAAGTTGSTFDAHLVIGANKGDVSAGNPIGVAAYPLDL
jgi:hypothetical protein